MNPILEPPQLGVLTKRMNGDDWLARVSKPKSHAILKYALNGLDQENRKLLIKRKLAELEPGGVLFSIARAVDSGEMLEQQLRAQGVWDLKITNLTNREIVALKPNTALFLSSSLLYKKASDTSHTKLKNFIYDVKKSIPVVNDDQLNGFPSTFAVNVLDVAMTWEVPSV